MKALILTTTLLLSLSAASKKIIEDFNGDMLLDTLLIDHSIGSGASSKEITYIDGKTAEKERFLFGSSYGAIRQRISIPSFLRGNSAKETRRAIASHLFPITKEKQDPTQYWITEGLKRYQELPPKQFFANYFTVEPQWHNSLPMPSSYTIETDTTWEIYYGHNHYQHLKGGKDSLQLSYSDKETKIYTTSHGVVAETAKGFLWLFITDSELTGSPSKLRWKSIKEVYASTAPYLIVIQQNPSMGSDQLFCINRDSGLCAKLNLSFLEYVTIIQKNLNIIITTQQKEKLIPLTKIIKEFDRLEKLQHKFE